MGVESGGGAEWCECRGGKWWREWIMETLDML